MDTKQLITGSPKEGFYPIVQDTVTVIELNKAVLNLTSESSSEDIIAAFDSVEDFTTLLQNVRNTENIVNGVLVNDSSLVGKIFCNIIAHTTQETLYIDGVFTDQYFNITITNTDGTFSCIQNAVHLNREVGDKTNVLILSLENDLANGQKDSPVTAEVSAALKDAISTGKACVIKSANSDILANLQQIGDNVTIIMEQISRVGQTFVAVNTTITVNTATNVISDYQTGAIVLETEGDGSKFLSNDGTYKEPQQIKGGTTIIGLDKTSQNYPGIVLGELNEASGETSIAGGSASIASGNFSKAIGRKCVASGNHSTAIGYKTIAKEAGSTALGFTCIASGQQAVSIGGANLNIHLVSTEGTNRYYVNGSTNFDNPTYDINKIQVGVEIISKTNSGNLYTTITKTELIDNVIYIETAESLGTFETPTVCGIGSNCSLGRVSFSANVSCAVGAYSAALSNGYAGGDNSFATGDYTYAYGECSSTFGKLTESWNKYECSVGIANKSTQSDDESIATRFTIGIGSGTDYSNAVRKNAVEIKANGDGYIIGVGNYDGTNADEENTKTIQEILNGVVTTDNVLTKDNTSPFTPTADYNPATKKYVDDKSKEVNILNETFTGLIGNIRSASNSDIFNYILTEEEYSYIISCIGKKNILPSNSASYHIFTNVEINKINYESSEGIVIKFIDTPTMGGVYSSSVNILINTNKEVEVFIYNVTGYNIDKDKIHFSINNIDCSKGTAPQKENTTESFELYKVITESEYSALGTTPNTDNILYFVIPD